MKAKILALGLGLALLTTGKAHASDNIVYLGGALSLPHCAEIAGARGFRLAIFGAGFDSNGVFYPYWNACFGQGQKGAGGELAEYFFYPYLSSGLKMSSCIADLKEVSGLWECQPWKGNHGYIMECEAKRRLTYDEGVRLKNEIARYKCVEMVDGPRQRRD